MLIGAATLPYARGRGIFTSLVHARWQEAVERGTPALVVQANRESGPILQKLGFETLGEIRLLADRL
jgi:predicted GNAT family acetyltransferase